MPTEIRPSQLQIVPLTKNIPILVASTTVEVTVSNTITETTFVSVTIPGGVLGTNNALMIRSVGSLLINSGGSLTWRLKYGGSNVAVTPAITPGAVATTYGGYILGQMKNNGVTNAQKATLMWQTDQIGFSGQGTGAINSAIDQTLAMSLQWSTASPAQTWIHWQTSVFVITLS